MFLTHPLPWFMIFTGLGTSLPYMIHALGWAEPAVAAMCVLPGCWETLKEQLQSMVGHTEQSQRKFLPCYPRIVKTEPTQHILGISKGILGLLAFLSKREVWSGGILMNQQGLVMLELLSKAL